MDIVTVGGPDCTLDLYHISRKLWYVFVIRCLVTRGFGQNLTTPVSVSIFFSRLACCMWHTVHTKAGPFRNIATSVQPLGRRDPVAVRSQKYAVFFLLKAREAQDTQEVFSVDHSLGGTKNCLEPASGSVWPSSLELFQNCVLRMKTSAEDQLHRKCWGGHRNAHIFFFQRSLKRCCAPKIATPPGAPEDARHLADKPSFIAYSRSLLSAQRKDSKLEQIMYKRVLL